MPVFLLDVAGDVTGRAKMRPAAGLGAGLFKVGGGGTRMGQVARPAPGPTASDKDGFLANLIRKYNLPADVAAQVRSLPTDAALQMMYDINREQENKQKFVDASGKAITQDQYGQLLQKQGQLQAAAHEQEMKAYYAGLSKPAAPSAPIKPAKPAPAPRRIIIKRLPSRSIQGLGVTPINIGAGIAIVAAIGVYLLSRK